jgi:tRNA modification GTPase
MVGSQDYTLDGGIIALATVSGQSALAILRLSGEGVHQLVQQHFSRPSALATHAVMIYGKLLDTDGSVLDEVMLTPFYAPKSYTGEDMVEIYCHGNMLIVQHIMALFCQYTHMRMALPGEFSYRAYMHGKIDLIQAEAVHELVSAQTTMASKAALARLHGQLTTYLEPIYQYMLKIAASLQSHIDYPDDETEEIPYFDLQGTIHQLTSLVNTAHTVRQWQNGVMVVLAGVPNVGKSSLFNLLLQQDRAIVSPQAGTTRDYLEAKIELGAWPIRLIDTAGLRNTHDDIEQQGVDKSLDLLAQADLIIYMIDAQQPDTSWHLQDYQQKTIYVANKCDLSVPDPQYIAISVHQHTGIDTLLKKIESYFVDRPEIDWNQPLLGSERQQSLTKKILEHVQFFSQHQTTYAIDELFFHVQQATQLLAQLLGHQAHTDIVSTMFSTFCLGK